MALLVLGGTFAQQYVSSLFHGKSQSATMALKLGVLSTARINAAAIVHPAETHPDVELYAIASRDARAAKTAARKHGFTKSYDSYQDLLADPLINMVYISLPNSLHHEWAMKALAAGKHVLCEKPFACNESEAREVFEEASKRNLIVEEAFHWQFHPAAHLFRDILQSNKYGRIIRTDAWMTSTPAIPAGDIRWQYDLGGGSLMDMSYVLSFTRYALQDRIPTHILSAAARPSKEDGRVDAAMHAHLIFEDEKDDKPVNSRIYTDMARSKLGGFLPRVWELPSIEVETDAAIILFYNAMMPHVYHYIAITDKRTGITEYKTQTSGGPIWGGRWTTGGKGGKDYWSTYRWQLEAFVEKVRGKEPICWVPSGDTLVLMRLIDVIYKQAGMPVRGDPKQIAQDEKVKLAERLERAQDEKT